jgi:hypothetical protein
MKIFMIGKVSATVASLLLVGRLMAADDSEPRRCMFKGRVYGVGQVLFVNDKIFQCARVYGDTVQPLYYWVRVTEEEARLREEEKKTEGEPPL